MTLVDNSVTSPVLPPHSSWPISSSSSQIKVFGLRLAFSNVITEEDKSADAHWYDPSVIGLSNTLQLISYR